MVFQPTQEQRTLIKHNGSAFVSACPGAGKTRCIVERARFVLSDNTNKRGVAFLSFTNAAISELQERLSTEGLLSSTPFPHFVGTFDRFIWSYLVTPFGLQDYWKPLKLIPDKDSLIIKPFPKAQPLPLRCFDRKTGVIIASEAKKHGFNQSPLAHQTAASRLRKKLLENGQLDFNEVRDLAVQNLKNSELTEKLASALKARFREIIVDEAQDCNPEDLNIIEWLRDTAKVATKVICDPHQSIYGFRDGVSGELLDFGNTFKVEDRLPLSGNFRSTKQICSAVHGLRAPDHRGAADEALGPMKSSEVPVHILSYSGQGVSTKIGEEFLGVVENFELDTDLCPVVAKVHSSAMKATGSVLNDIGQSLSQRLADAAMSYQNARTPQHRLEALLKGHKIGLEVAGKTSKSTTYHQAIAENALDEIEWRGQFAQILKALAFNTDAGHTRSEWLSRARHHFGALLPAGGRTISQLLRNEQILDTILTNSDISQQVARTIHSVKGLEFPGICVTLTSKTAGKILSHLEGQTELNNAESARELYVGASRAEILLAIACPKSQSARLAKHLTSFGATCVTIDI